LRQDDYKFKPSLGYTVRPFLKKTKNKPGTSGLSYSGGRDQEDHGLKPTQANISRDPILKTSSQK
jgi:hypothetical protein